MRTHVRIYTLILIAFFAPAVYANVNPDGSFSYSLPIEVPAGRQGLQPQLALTYNSNSPNGMVGVGWSLSGLPAITRMNYGNGINYDTNDTYAGPEGRLISMGSDVYHAENETWSKYEASGNCGNGPCSWIVTDRNGVKYYYGLTSNSRIAAKDSGNNAINGGAIRIWALERVEDLHGNYYEVAYKKDAGLLYDNGQYYPEKISYTLGNGASKHYAVSLFYDESGRPDKEISYAQSAYVKTNWRLSKIAVDYQSSCFWLFTCSDRVRSYVLGYEVGPNIQLTRLLQWKEFNAENLELPSTQFNWADLQEAPITENRSIGDIGSTPFPANCLSGDFDGNGKTDFACYVTTATMSVKYSTGSGFNAQNKYVGDIGSTPVDEWCMAMDLNGDGKTDIGCYVGAGYLSAKISNGDGFDINYWTIGDIGSTPFTSHCLPGDFDGNGKTDLACYTTTSTVSVKLSTGSGFNTTNWTIGDIGSSPIAQWCRVGDFNGDSKSDIGCYVGAQTFSVKLSTGSNFNIENWNIGDIGATPFNSYCSVTVMNSDGKTDVACYVGNQTLSVKISTGSGFSIQNWSIGDIGANPFTSYCLSGDFDKNGKPDFACYTTTSTMSVKLNMGDQFKISDWPVGDIGSTPPSQWCSVGDFDGDAKHEIGCYVGAASLSVKKFTSTKSNQISSVTLPNAALIAVGYQLSTTEINATCNGPCTSPDNTSLTYTNGYTNPSPRYLVKTVTTISNMDLDGNGFNDTFTTEYTYYNGRMTTGTIPERASLGFEKIMTKDVNTNNYKIDTYRQDKPFHGRLKSSRSYVYKGGTLWHLASETITPALAQYYCDDTGCTLNTTPIATPTLPQQLRSKVAAQLGSGEVASATTTSYENGIATASKQEEILSFDTYGNALSVTQSVSSNGLSKTTYKFAQYINDLGTVRTVGLPFNEKVCTTSTACTTGDSNFVSESNTYFDGATSTGSIGTRKIITKKESYLSTGTSTGVWVGETFTYDSLGNVTQRIDAQGITTAIIYDSDYKQYPVSVTKSHGGQSSTVEYDYDYRFGKKTLESTLDDGNVTIYTIDASGFVTQQQTQNGATILAKKQFSHSAFGTAPIWTQECTYYGLTFTTPSCRKKFIDALGRAYREEFPELVAGVETQRAIERRFLIAQNGACKDSETPNGTVRKKDYLSKPQPATATTENFTSSFNARSFPGEWTENCSDELGRPTQVKTHENKVTSTAYQNPGTATTPPSGTVMCTVTTDVDGTKKRSCDGIEGKPALVTEGYTLGQATDVHYYYDNLNRLTSVVAPQGTTTITYIGRSQLQESIIDPVVGTTSFEYFLIPGQANFMKLKKETRPATTAGTVVTDLEYNASFGRLSKTTKTDSVTNYTYDETAQSYGKGRLTTESHVIDGYTIEDKYSYNYRGETTNTTRRISHATETLCSNVNAMPCLQTFGSTKDELGRVKTMTYPDGKVTTINYLAGSTKNVSSIVHDGTTYASYTNYTYDVMPHVGKVTYGNGVEHSYTYQPEDGLLKTVAVGKPATDPYIDLELDYNAALNINRIEDKVIPTFTIEYQYDTLNRLKQAKWDADEIGVPTLKVYKFDNDGGTNSKGNLEQKHHRQLTYAAGKTYPVSDKLWNASLNTWQANQSYTWSGNGNLLTKGPLTFTYDSNNMLKQAVEVDGSSATVGDTKFYYDQSGQRFLKKHTRNGTTIKTWYLGDGVEVREKFVGVSSGTPTGSYDSSQTTKYIYGIDDKKLASITGSVYTAALAPTSSSMLALADGYSSSTLSGIAGKTFYSFYGIYAHEDFAKGARLSALVMLALVLMAWLARNQPAAPALWRRATALLVALPIFTLVNCQWLEIPGSLGITQGQIDTMVSELYTGLPTGTVYYSHNHLGSGVLVTDASGNEHFRITYTEYGEIDLEKSGKYNPTTELIEHDVDDAKIMITAVKYTGQEYDPETGLYYYNARYYDPQLGVFTTPDTKVPDANDPMGYNRHMYVRGNPIRYSDPMGHWWFDDVVETIGDIVTAAVAVVALPVTAVVVASAAVYSAATNTNLGSNLISGFNDVSRAAGYGVVGAAAGATFGGLAASSLFGSSAGSIGSFLGAGIGGTNGALAGYYDIYSEDKNGMLAFFGDSTIGLPTTAVGLGLGLAASLQGFEIDKDLSRKSNAFFYMKEEQGNFGFSGLAIGNRITVRYGRQFKEKDPGLFKELLRHELAHTWQYRALGPLMGLQLLLLEQIPSSRGGLGVYDPYEQNWTAEHQADIWSSGCVWYADCNDTRFF